MKQRGLKRAAAILAAVVLTFCSLSGLFTVSGLAAEVSSVGQIRAEADHTDAAMEGLPDAEISGDLPAAAGEETGGEEFAPAFPAELQDEEQKTEQMELWGSVLTDEEPPEQILSDPLPEKPEQVFSDEMPEQETESAVDEGGFLGEYEPVKETKPLFRAASVMLAAASPTAKFYTVSDADDGPGAGDIFFYGMIDGKKVTAYCMNFGKNDPKGISYSSASAAAGLGYIMCNGTHTGITDRYTTQLAVYLFLGYTLDGTYYNNNGGLMATLRTVATNMGADISQARSLANAASGAASYYSQFATRWTTTNSNYQNMVTFNGVGSLSLIKAGDIGTDPVGYAVYTIYQSDQSTVVGWFITTSAGTGYVVERIPAEDISSYTDKTAQFTSVTTRGKAASDIAVPKGKVVKTSGDGTGTLVNKTLSSKTTYSFGRLNPAASYWFARGSSKVMSLPAGKYYYKEVYEPINQLYDRDTQMLGPVTVTRGETTEIKAVDSRKTGSIKLRKKISDGALVISKTTQGAGADLSQEFLFTVELSDAAGNALEGTYSYTGTGGKSDGTLTLENGKATVALSDGQSVRIVGLPAGTRYRVSETETEGYTPSANPISGQIADNRSFSFTINIKNGGENVKALSMPYSGSSSGTLKTNTNGNATVSLEGGQMITISGIPIGYTYSVTEKAVSGFTATKVGDTGTVSASASAAVFNNTPSDKTAAFRNTLNLPDRGSFSLSKTVEESPGTVTVKKVVENGRASDEEKEFTFRLTEATKSGITYSKFDASEDLLPDYYDIGIPSDGSGFFTLRNGQSVRLSMPAGTAYTIEELPEKTEGITSAGLQEDLYRIFAEGSSLAGRSETAVVSGLVPAADPDTFFTFRVEVTDENGAPADHLEIPYSGTLNGMPAEASVTTDANGQFLFSVLREDAVLFYDLPEGYRYTVRELPDESFEPAADNAENVLITSGVAEETRFVNTFQPETQRVTFFNVPAEAKTTILKQGAGTSFLAQLSDVQSGNNEYQKAHGTPQEDANRMYSGNLTDAVFHIQVFDRNEPETPVYEADHHPTSCEVNAETGKLQASFDLTDAASCSAVQSGTAAQLFVGDKVVITEKSAPKGYLLPQQADADVSDTQILPDLSAERLHNTVTFADEPAFAPADLHLYKKALQYENGDPVVTDRPVRDEEHYSSPMGAVFLVSYYDNENADGLPVRYWYFMTDETGRLCYSQEQLIGGEGGISFDDPAFYSNGTLNALLPEGFLWENRGALFTDQQGQYGLPLGSLSITEVWAPAGYKLFTDAATGESYVLREKITQDPATGMAEISLIDPAETIASDTGGAVRMEEGILYAGDEALNLAILKTDSRTGERLSGVEYLLRDLQEEEKQYRYQTGQHSMPVIRGFLERGHSYELYETDMADGYVLNEDRILFTVEENGDLAFEDDTVICRKVCVDAQGRTGENGDPCFLLSVTNEPNRLTLLKTDEAGAPLRDVVFQVKAGSLLEADHSTILAYRDEAGTKPFRNGDTLTTDAEGKAVLYRLNTGVSLTMENGQEKKTRTDETYFLTETKTVSGRQLLADRLSVKVTKKGRILMAEGAAENEGEIRFTLAVKNHMPVTLMTGGEGTALFYLFGGLTVLLAGMLVIFTKKPRKTSA